MRKFEVSLKGDSEGMIGRECPSPECNKYFKVLISELKESKSGSFFCPYCGKPSHPKNFITKDQLEYAKSLVVQQVMGEISEELKKLEMKPDPRAFISLGIEVKVPSPPIRVYMERELSKKIHCEKCGRIYRVYGTSFYCPYCGPREPLSVYKENIEMVKAFVDFKETLQSDVKLLHTVSQAGIIEKLVERSLDMLVTAFETYCKTKFVNVLLKDNPSLSEEDLLARIRNKFQNLNKGNKLWLQYFNLNYLSVVSKDEFELATKGFEKRHVLVHNSGIIDLRYIATTGESRDSVGQRVTVSRAEVKSIMMVLQKIVDLIEKSISTNTIKA